MKAEPLKIEVKFYSKQAVKACEATVRAFEALEKACINLGKQTIDVEVREKHSVKWWQLWKKRSSVQSRRVIPIPKPEFAKGGLTHDRVFNVNDEVGLTLTDKGIVVLVNHLNKYCESNPKIKATTTDDIISRLDEEGLYWIQMWYMMQVFGPHIGMCSPILFKGGIRVKPDNSL